jgi:hypothetical protein
MEQRQDFADGAFSMNRVLNCLGFPHADNGIGTNIEEVARVETALCDATAWGDDAAVTSSLLQSQLLGFPEVAHELEEAWTNAAGFHCLQEAFAVQGVASFLQVEENLVEDLLPSMAASSRWSFISIRAVPVPQPEQKLWRASWNLIAFLMWVSIIA